MAKAQITNTADHERDDRLRSEKMIAVKSAFSKQLKGGRTYVSLRASNSGLVTGDGLFDISDV